MEIVVVERRFDEPTSVERLQEQEDGAAWCLETHQVRPLRSYVSSDGKRMLCLYEAPDAEAVRAVQRTVQMPFEAIWSARIFSNCPGQKDAR
jgi:hypothetical protein